MQRAVGIIAEYNPFHNGHAYQLKQAKALSSLPFAIAVMSGAFVQRGECAAFDKFTRAKWALQNGADLVLELPAAFAVCNAERFARGGIGTLAGTGLVDAIAFGAEDASLPLLRKMAFAEESEAFRTCLAQFLGQGLSYPAARARALAEALDGAKAAMPNNILGAEYVKALAAFAPHISPIPVKRIGAAHDSADVQAGFSSASAIRTAAKEKDVSFIPATVPADVSSDILRLLEADLAPASLDGLSDAVVYALRRMEKDALAALPDVAEGLENPLYEKARSETELNTFLAAVKTKRYTLARLRRTVSHALLGFDKTFFAVHSAPCYLRVLGVRRTALPLLSAMQREASLPIVTDHKSYLALDKNARALFEKDLFAAELQAMAFPAPQKAKSEFSRPLLIV
ncbi:MAG: nucleotidyltransferase family protein [Clostridiales bacterium]|nr:nucleotidyltransferase family protein [Clostridiales bacterium]